MDQRAGRSCTWCGDALPPRSRIDTEYCSGRCRVAAHRAAKNPSVPAELRSKHRWVRVTERRIPLRCGGGMASSTDPDTWSTWERASSSRSGVGMAFVLNGDGVVCIDLDDCITDGVLAQWAKDVLARCPRTYTEVSPSGTGLHIWGHGSVVRGRRIRDGERKIEYYGTSRIMTVTGQRWTGSTGRLADLSEVISSL